MSVYSKIRGTSEALFSLLFGATRVQVKNNAGAVEFRNDADSGFVNARGATPVVSNDLATKGYVDTSTPLTGGGEGLTLFGTTSTAGITGNLAITGGGTGTSTAQGAFDALSPLTTQGDVLYFGGTGHNNRLGPGVAGQVLTTGGPAANPSWTTPGGGGKATRILNNVAGPIANFTASYTPSAAGKNLLIHVGVTGFTTNVAGQAITVNLQVDGVTVGSQSVFAGNNLLHFVFPAFCVPVNALSVAAHTIALTAGTGYNSDGNEFASITVQEL